MLRSFQYTEKSYLDYKMQSDVLRNQEINIARKYVESHNKTEKEVCNCPVCKNGVGKHFYNKWGVEYVRCNECKTVYAIYEDETVTEYNNSEELLGLRLSEEYQSQITENRENVWNDFLDWLSVRSFRFMRRREGLNIVDIGNRFRGYTKCIQQSKLCGIYNLRESILQESEETIKDGEADIVFYLDQMQKEMRPVEKLVKIGNCLKDDGLLVLNTRAGSGFDIIALKENNEKIYPYEHILLPSVKGLMHMLEDSGYEVLEITTPGVMDVKYVMDSKDKLGDDDIFLKYLMEESNQSALQEFQRFLQKNCMSSFVCVIARKVKR